MTKNRRDYFAVFTVLVVVAVMLSYFVRNCYLCGGLYNSWQALTGICLLSEPYVLDLGEVTVGKSKTGTFLLRNVSGKPAVVLGIEASCGCVFTADLPMTIMPYKTAEFPITFTASGQEKGEVEQIILLNLNINQPNKPLIIRAVIIEPTLTQGKLK